jgi:CBS domain-containing protein
MYEFLKYEVRDAMTADPIAIGPHTRLREAEQLFERHQFNGLPVVDDQRHLIGILTKLDLLKAFSFDAQAMIPPYNAIMEQIAAAVMTSNPVRVEPNLPLSRLLQKLVDTGAKSLPVVENGRLVGIISRKDVMKALRRAAVDREIPPRGDSPA